MTCYTRPWFWHWTFFWPCWVSNQQNITARFARPKLPIIAANQNQLCKIKNRPGNTTAQKKQTKLNYHHFYLLQKNTYRKNHPKEQPANPTFINPEISELGFRVLTFVVSYNAGIKRPRPAVRLNDLLCAPFIFALILIFIFLNTGPAEHRNQICTTPTNDLTPDPSIYLK